MSFNHGLRKPSTQWATGHSGGWGPYWSALFPPAEVTAWIDYKRGSSGVNGAGRFWEQREYLRRTYESVFGPATPPAWAANGSSPGGHSPLLAARRHETSDGAQR